MLRLINSKLCSTEIGYFRIEINHHANIGTKAERFFFGESGTFVRGNEVQSGAVDDHF